MTNRPQCFCPGKRPRWGLTGLEPFPGGLHVFRASFKEPRRVKYSLRLPAALPPASTPESATLWPAPGSLVGWEPSQGEGAYQDGCPGGSGRGGGRGGGGGGRGEEGRRGRRAGMRCSPPCWPLAHSHGLPSHLQHGFPRKPQQRPGPLQPSLPMSVRLQNFHSQEPPPPPSPAKTASCRRQWFPGR